MDTKTPILERLRTAADNYLDCRFDEDCTCIYCSAIAEIEALRHSLAGLLDYTDRHRVTWADHGHDCFELWCIERDYARTLLPDNGIGGGSNG